MFDRILSLFEPEMSCLGPRGSTFDDVVTEQ